MSFAKEISDFINGVKTGQAILGAKTDRQYKQMRMKALQQAIDKGNDPERNKLELDYLKARVNRMNRGPNRSPELENNRKLRGEGIKLDNEFKRRRLEGPAPEAPAPVEEIPFTPGKGSDAGAIPGVSEGQTADVTSTGNEDDMASYDTADTQDTGAEGDTASYDTADAGDTGEDTYDESAVPVDDTQYAARGGVVRKVKGYAAGGEVESDDEDAGEGYDESDDTNTEQPDEATDEAPVSALPTRTAQAEPTPAPAEGGKPQFSMAAAHDAVRDGLTYGTEELSAQSRGAIRNPQQTAHAQAIARGAGAATPEQMAALYKKVDEAAGGHDKLTDGERNMAVLGAVWQWQNNKGDMRAARETAWKILQNYRVQSQRWAGVTAAAAEQGDVDGAIKAALKTYSYIPDGRHVSAAKTPDGNINFSVTDENGDKVNGGVATPQQMAAQAMGVAAGGFDKFILQAAGEREGAAGGKGGKGGKGGPKGMTPRDREQAVTTNTTAADAYPDQEGIKAQKGPLANVSYELQQANAKISPDAAFKAVVEMTRPGPATFGGAKKVEGGIQLTMSDGRPVIVPEDMVPVLRKLREANMKVFNEKAAKDQASAKRSKENIDAAGRLLTQSPVRTNPDDPELGYLGAP